MKALDYLLKIPLDKSWGAAMALLVEYKCEQTNPKHVTIKHTIYQAYKRYEQ